MTGVECREAVFELLKNLRGLDPLKELFWSELNYERVNKPLSRRGWSDTAANAVAEDPVLFAAGGEDSSFHIIYSRLDSDKLLLGQQRSVISKLIRDHQYALFIFSNKARDRWHFVNVKPGEDPEKRRLFRRITIGPEERLRTATERIALLDLERIERDLFGLSPLAIQKAHDDAFDVEKVTRQFFEDYKSVFDSLSDDLRKQTKDRGWAHDYALQFVNRLMFLYFVQRKRWLGDDTEFLRVFWESYRTSGQPEDTFFDRWLKVLFFQAFNNKWHGGHEQFPKEINTILATAPYLNGGLFTENELDTKYTFTITDGRFEKVFKFLESYNFTIAEDTPLDQEVAVDPEMIGKVYESLVNVSEEADERGEAGIFYTPRTEIDLMCRLALVDHLTNHLGNEGKPLLYEAVFAFDPEEKHAADRRLERENLWPELDRLLRQITVLDPACGSGSFLVGMLRVLDDLIERGNQVLGQEETPYERKRRIIGRSLYGVDVMDWACHVAELRLWLHLVIDSIEPAELRFRPLLPNLSFNIRCGDSLVQEVGGINLAHIKTSAAISPSLKGRLTRLKGEKLKFYNNDKTCRYRNKWEIEREELLVFRDILDAQCQALAKRIKQIERKVSATTTDLVGATIREIDEKTAKQLELELERLRAEVDRAEQARKCLKSPKEMPFVWDVAFVEVFAGDKQGFDIVVGNPPYVRQENIRDPRSQEDSIRERRAAESVGARRRRAEGDGTPSEGKRAYKAKLARSVYQTFPTFFRYDAGKDKPARKLDAKSDLYIYFYFHGLSLLNPKGSFCFITSNSWLDVGYGKDLQEFLLKHCHVKLVIDNQAKRSFASADVNTVIVLFSAPGRPANEIVRARRAVPLEFGFSLDKRGGVRRVRGMI